LGLAAPKTGGFPLIDEKEVLDSDGLRRALVRIAHEILERNKGTRDLALIGIRTGGAHLARRIQVEIRAIENVEVPLGIVDITLYRDDLSELGPQAKVQETKIPFDITGRKVVLVDDVLYTGRTIRAALDALVDFGRPRSIQLAVLVDRGHRELPIKPDYVGKNIPTAQSERVEVRLREDGKSRDELVIVSEGEKP
jgi:pyrimidine operon attenuation protein/uracil phosphoribosyltransferase